MDYKFTVIYKFEGIASSNLDKGIIVYEDDAEAEGISVFLTSDVMLFSLQS